MIKDELSKRIMSYVLCQLEKQLMANKDSDAFAYSQKLNKQYAATYETLKLCTIEQLWSLYKYTENNTSFSVLPCNPKDHLAISLGSCLSASGSMYVGIEQDGYAHS